MIEGEVTYDNYGNEVEDNAADDVGGLSMYSDPNVQKNMTNLEKLAKQQTDRYDALEKALAEKRYGPSFSERMFQLSAALATPTAQRGIGGILENVTPVLAAQQQAKRAGELSRREALDKLQNDRLAQQVGLAKQGLSTSLAMARINQPKPPVGIDVGGVLVDRSSNRPINPQYSRVPKPEYYKALEKDPTEENLKAAVEYYPTFAVDLKAAYERGLKNKGR